MATKYYNMSFSNIAFLIIFSVSLLNMPQQTFAGRFFPNNAGGRGGGICATAVTMHGYKCQEYQVTTGDGFVLGLQRIPKGRGGGGGGGRRPPVLLQHGLFVDGVTWLMNSPEQSLAMILADKGFDVWISNCRGTRYSRRHVSLDPNHPKFWDWTWDDMTTHDLPSMINFVFKKTRQQIHYVGHSMGTLMALVSSSQGKLANVKSAALLSPVAYLSHITAPLVVLAAKSFLGELGATFGIAEFDPKKPEAINFLRALCVDPTVDCYDLLTTLTGKNCCLNGSTIDNFLKSEPQSTATKNLVHFAQNVRNGVLSRYDYGNVYINMQHYGVATPPVYDLSKIPRDFPIFLSYGGQDALSSVKDVDLLLDVLKMHNKDKIQVQYIKEYAHVDFIMGVNANKLVYTRMIDFFRKHN